MNKLIELFFRRRGLSVEDLRDRTSLGSVFLPDLDLLCGRLHAARQAGRRVVVFTDFDMDGIMSGVVGFAGLSELGFRASLMPAVPSSGYGMHKEDVDRIGYAFGPGCVILTGDVGIGEESSVAYAAEAGFEVLVTDHHAGTAPSGAAACVDPMLGPDWAFKDICGAHVMYLVLRRYAELYCGLAEIRQIDRLRVFAGIATVADSMPVFHENRQLILDSVALMRTLWANGDQAVVDLIPGNDVYRRAMLGVFVICEAFRGAKKLSDGDSLNETFLGFYLVPLFNSLKRMDGDLTLAYDVFFGGYERAVACMEELFRLNESRKKAVADAETQTFANSIQNLAPYVYCTQAPHGIRGLLAQKGMQANNGPCVVIGCDDGVWKGSGRSPSWFEFLTETAGIPGVHPAGHQGAFGITLDGLGAAQELYRILSGKVGAARAAGKVSAEKPELWLSTVDPAADGDADVDMLFEFLTELESYRPFGPGFRDPSVKLEFRSADARWFRFGKEGQHVKAVLPRGFSVMWFNQAGSFAMTQADQVDVAKLPPVVSVTGVLSLNRYMGTCSVQFMAR